MLIWIDCEMTGLDPKVDELVEIAAIVTDGQLNELDEGLTIVIKPSEAALAQMGDFVRKMHTDSGLLADLPEGVSVAQAEEQVLEYLGKHLTEEQKAPLAGNSVGTDRTFLAAQMPTLESRLHYRNVDVSTIKELASRWQPLVFQHSPEKHGNHRALADILESIAELRYYREAFIGADPGPAASQLREISARHQSS